MLKLKNQIEEYHNGYNNKLDITVNGMLSNTTGDVVILNFERLLFNYN